MSEVVGKNINSCVRFLQAAAAYCTTSHRTWSHSSNSMLARPKCMFKIPKRVSLWVKFRHKLVEKIEANGPLTTQVGFPFDFSLFWTNKRRNIVATVVIVHVFRHLLFWWRLDVYTTYNKKQFSTPGRKFVKWSYDEVFATIIAFKIRDIETLRAITPRVRSTSVMIAHNVQRIHSWNPEQNL